MEICNKILHSYAIYCRKEMVKILKCNLIPKKSYDTLSKGAIFFGQPCNSRVMKIWVKLDSSCNKLPKQPPFAKSWLRACMAVR